MFGLITRDILWDTNCFRISEASYYSLTEHEIEMYETSTPSMQSARRYALLDGRSQGARTEGSEVV